MNAPPKLPNPALERELAEALEIMRNTAAGDVAGEPYGEALARASRKLTHVMKPWRIRPPPRA